MNYLFVENKVKATYNWIIALLFLFSYVVNKLYETEQLTLFLIYLSIYLGLVIYGFYIYRLKRVLTLLEEALIIIPWIILCSLLIYQTNGLHSLFFPGIYFIVLIYASFIKENKYFIIANVLGTLVLFYWAFFTDNQLYWTYLMGYIIYLISYIAIVVVIRCYCSICLFCDLN